VRRTVGDVFDYRNRGSQCTSEQKDNYHLLESVATTTVLSALVKLRPNAFRIQTTTISRRQPNHLVSISPSTSEVTLYSTT
jgi:hypothetical protein